MADWRQIQARIRKAKNSPEAVSKLSELFQRTRDGMVAWELGAIEEKADHKQEAGKWYILAAQRFRRADWKKKCEDALIRLGLPLPQSGAPEPTRVSAQSADTTAETAVTEGEETPPALALGEIPEEKSEMPQEVSYSPQSMEPGQRKRRRGRRGGRGRRRKGVANAPGLPTQAFADHPTLGLPPISPSEAPLSPLVERRATDRVEIEPPSPERLRPIRVESPAPQLPSERTAHGRSDPAVASRMAHLESLLRRLLSSPLRRLDAAEEAPAGPGVFLLSDSDQTTSYYVEACQTLRVGIGNLVRGGKGGRGVGQGASEPSLKSKLADHLEINETRVGQYLKDHCVIRWIQLDDDASLLAHFAIAVLRTPLNLP
jgi:hypothetical protein